MYWSTRIISFKSNQIVDEAAGGVPSHPAQQTARHHYPRSPEAGWRGRLARSGPGPEIGLAWMGSLPGSGFTRPRSTFRKVVLPQPDGPTIDRNSHSSTSISKP